MTGGAGGRNGAGGGREWCTLPPPSTSATPSTSVLTTQYQCRMERSGARALPRGGVPTHAIEQVPSKVRLAEHRDKLVLPQWAVRLQWQTLSIMQAPSLYCALPPLWLHLADHPPVRGEVALASGEEEPHASGLDAPGPHFDLRSMVEALPLLTAVLVLRCQRHRELLLVHHMRGLELRCQRHRELLLVHHMRGLELRCQRHRELLLVPPLEMWWAHWLGPYLERGRTKLLNKLLWM